MEKKNQKNDIPRALTWTLSFTERVILMGPLQHCQDVTSAPPTPTPPNPFRRPPCASPLLRDPSPPASPTPLPLRERTMGGEGGRRESPGRRRERRGRPPWGGGGGSGGGGSPGVTGRSLPVGFGLAFHVFFSYLFFFRLSCFLGRADCDL